YTPVTIDTASSVTRAYELRPEVREGRLTSEIKRINYLYAKNQTLPQLDLILSYGASGLAGRAADIDPVTGIPTGTFTTTGYTESLRQIGANDFPSWTIGFNVGIPVFNIGAKSQAKVAE